MSDNIINVPPNWADPVVERLEWMTDVLPGFDTSEQRVRLRKNPRRTFSYSFAVAGIEAQRLRMKLHETSGSGMWLPDWTDPRHLALSYPAGSGGPTGEIEIDDITGLLADRTVAGQTVEGTWVIFWRSPSDYEVHRIIKIFSADNEIRLETPLAAAWNKGDRLFTLCQGVLRRPIRFTEHTTSVVSGSITFPCQTDVDVDWPWDVTLDQYQSLDVWDDPPNRREAFQSDWRRDFSIIDFDTGIYRAFDRSAFENINHRCTYSMLDVAAVRRFRGFLFRRSGKLQPFWSVFSTQDVNLVFDLGGGANSIIIDDIGYTAAFANGNPAGAVYLKTIDGTRFYMTVQSSAVNAPGQEEITFIEFFGQPIAKADVKLLSFLYQMRLNHDQVELAHIKPGVAESQLTLTAGRL